MYLPGFHILCAQSSLKNGLNMSKPKAKMNAPSLYDTKNSVKANMKIYIADHQ